MLIINLSQNKSAINEYLSSTLLKVIKENLEKNKKIILYLNKRWEFSSLICTECSYIYKCDFCDNSFSVHKYPEKLICHICWHNINIPIKCIKCNKNTLKKVWIWTQQIETIIKKIFTKNKIFRFDTDAVKNKKQKEEALKKLKEADIIVGTKMITTWFDFKNIWLIGVILLEQELLIPKYDTEEKVISNIKQLIGRWWRKGEKTKIIIQTFIAKNDIVKTITQDNYKEFFIKTLEERKNFLYPPFIQMATLEYRHKKKQDAKDFMIKIKDKLDKKNTENRFDIILISKSFKKYNQFFYKIIIKWDNIRNFVKNIKNDIFKNSNLVVIFE